MTAEEAILIIDPKSSSEALEKIECYGGFSGKLAKVFAVREACAMAVAALREQEKRRWIPVTERLPDDGDSVIVVVSGKIENTILHDAIEFAEFSIDEGWILEMWPEWEDPNVTYWMPLPEPQKEDA